MCLAIPSKIVEKNGNLAVIDVDGDLGDWVIVHAGFAIHKIDEKSALETLAFLKEAAAHWERQP